MQGVFKRIMTTPHNPQNLYPGYSQREKFQTSSPRFVPNPHFFTTIVGGQWHTYSCSVWHGASTITQAQENKLNIFAKKMHLKKGARILDVSCGWGGPITYFCKQYGVEGVGITTIPEQYIYAEQRVKENQVQADIRFQHWQELPEDEIYDAIYADEAVVNLADAQGFFEKCKRLLKPNGKLVIKELHFTHSTHAPKKNKPRCLANAIYGFAGKYRTLHEELQLIDNAGLQLQNIDQIPIQNYWITIHDQWLRALEENKGFLCHLTSAKYVKNYSLCLYGYLRRFNNDVFRLHMITASPKGQAN